MVAIGRRIGRARHGAVHRALGLALTAGLLSACGGGGGDGSIAPSNLFSAAAVADIDGDGLPDVVAVYSTIAGPPPHPGFVAVYLQDRSRPGSFLPAVSYGAGTDPVSVAVSDLDGDGRPDVVVSNAILRTDGAGSSTVSVLLQDPAHPGRLRPATAYPTGFNPKSVAIADLNGDGKSDLAVAAGSGVSLLLQDPLVPGSFRPATSIDLGTYTYAVTTADLDGDGRTDLVVTGPTLVFTLIQNPRVPGTFLAPTSYAAGAQPIHTSVADLDGDGRPDLAVANLGSPSDPSSSSASVLLQDRITPGRFAAAANYPTDYRSEAVAIADFNGDGRPDLAVANMGTLAGGCPPDCSTVRTGVSVLLHNAAVPGSFLAAVNYPPNGNDFVTWVVAADLNGDGQADLLVVQANGVFVRFQDPAHPGQFLAAVALQK